MKHSCITTFSEGGYAGEIHLIVTHGSRRRRTAAVCIEGVHGEEGSETTYRVCINLSTVRSSLAVRADKAVLGGSPFQPDRRRAGQHEEVLKVACWAHAAFENIHPFGGGNYNGWVGRLYVLLVIEY